MQSDFSYSPIGRWSLRSWRHTICYSSIIWQTKKLLYLALRGQLHPQSDSSTFNNNNFAEDTIINVNFQTRKVHQQSNKFNPRMLPVELTDKLLIRNRRWGSPLRIDKTWRILRRKCVRCGGDAAILLARGIVYKMPRMTLNFIWTRTFGVRSASQSTGNWLSQHLQLVIVAYSIGHRIVFNWSSLHLQLVSITKIHSVTVSMRSSHAILSLFLSVKRGFSLISKLEN